MTVKRPFVFGVTVHPRAASQPEGVASEGLRPVCTITWTSNVCPGTGAAIVAGGANAAAGPVGSAVPAGCAIADTAGRARR